MVAVHEIKDVLTLNKAVYVGMCIFNLIKTLMYEFHYNYIKDRYGKKAKILFTDTDSLVYKTGTNEVYENFHRNKDMFDFCEYPENSVLQKELIKTLLKK